MNTILDHSPVMLIIAIFSRHPDAVSWGLQQAEDRWGAIGIQSDPIPFSETHYYEHGMGSELYMTLTAFENLINPENLSQIKHETITIEKKSAASGLYPDIRPLNLDPGYLTAAKFVLATTKDGSHRLYLGHGIFGEITLQYRHKQWQNQEWTYPNYRRNDYKEFLIRCRKIVLANARIIY